ncbi:MAG: ATP-dependent DNA ligase [Hamadaea sp.]|uniref:ATP-dependent DNA ligase n=1 Tax=Hamadaea sp. TaxID=2024425 RepID=UPI001833198B|nr:ATP-dependent DNA ligase [Hamadaea sp.]NUR72776.1 ATP-dependent DNA ligase [Hamadaea sp.]NUT22876.1 ATP-dependent DNA ligase [Hamadaea sp.]
MRLPLTPPLEPMLATAVPEIPVAEGMSYEPKWDGFRCIVFRDGDEVALASRGGKDFTRYFPEVIDQVKAQLPERCVVDCELVVIRREEGKLPRLDFELLAQRIHPAASRVRKLAEETPAEMVAFDLLAIGDEDLTQTPFPERRARLEAELSGVRPPVHVTPLTTDPETARRWFVEFEGAGLDGLIAKPADLLYVPNKRLMRKIKHARTLDAVVAGFRWHKSGPIVGSLLLGLYDDDGLLHSIGVTSAFSAARRKELLDEIAELRDPAEHPWLDPKEGQRLPSAPNRWNSTKDTSWEPLAPNWVVEIGFDAMEGDRLRHTGQFVRWRPERDPRSCTYEQLDRPIRLDVEEVLASGK